MMVPKNAHFPWSPLFLIKFMNVPKSTKIKLAGLVRVILGSKKITITLHLTK